MRVKRPLGRLMTATLKRKRRLSERFITRIVKDSRAKTNILNVNEQIIFLKNEYSNILYIISISLIALNHKGTGRSS